MEDSSELERCMRALAFGPLLSPDVGEEALPLVAVAVAVAVAVVMVIAFATSLQLLRSAERSAGPY